MLFHADLGGRQKTVGDCGQPGFAVAMPMSINGDGFKAEIDSGQMGAGGDAGVAQDRDSKQPAEPGRLLKHGQLGLGVEIDDRQLALVLVEIVGERIKLSAV